jgi:hypothetical protein
MNKRNKSIMKRINKKPYNKFRNKRLRRLQPTKKNLRKKRLRKLPLKRKPIRKRLRRRRPKKLKKLRL